MINKLVLSKATIAILSFGLSAPASATASEISGSVVVDEATTIVHTQIQGELELPSSREAIKSGNLKGTWTYGNTSDLGFGSVWYSVTGESTGAGKAKGRAIVRDGKGVEATGGWKNPGFNSYATIKRTTSGSNSAYWSLGNP
ncbi:hypothetical protein [Enterococcus sp. DIV1314a]|uniref:hypothetical protein n=1 Tax=Enterococcus sp. DIV1314a TaxID=2774660 RepID=UPI003F2360AC